MSSKICLLWNSEAKSMYVMS